MKVLLVNISLDAKLGGGTAERTRHLAVSLTKAGCQCSTMAMTGNSWASEFTAHSIDSHITGRLGKRFPIPLLNPFKAWREAKDTDVIHIMGYWNLLSVYMGVVARLTGTPYVLCPAGEFASIAQPRPIMKVFHRLLGRSLIANAKGYIAITSLEQELVAKVAGVPLGSVMVIPNAVGIPTMFAKDQSCLEKIPPRPYMLFMGRLAPVKGPDLLVAAYIDTPIAHEYDLVMAGPDFGMQSELRKNVEIAGLIDRVHFVGHLNESERNSFYKGAELLVIPSRSEAMSLVALEAGIHGLPVLLTDTCGFDQIEAVGGGLVVPASVLGVATGLAKMLEFPQELSKQGEYLKSYVAENFTWDMVALRLKSWLESLRGQQAR
jgi:glycosyltransferase involved in cell wall biosynthesis